MEFYIPSKLLHYEKENSYFLETLYNTTHTYLFSDFLELYPLTTEKIQLEESYNAINGGDNNIIEIIENLCELVENLSVSYKEGDDAKKGKIIRAMQCELIINNKKELTIKGK